MLIKFGSISVSWDLLDSILQNLMKHDRPFGKFPSPKSFILRVLKSKLSSLLKSFRTVHFMRKYFCACSNSKANPIQTHLGHLMTQPSSTSHISINCPAAIVMTSLIRFVAWLGFFHHQLAIKEQTRWCLISAYSVFTTHQVWFCPPIIGLS